MAKIDITKIEGYDKMTPEEKLAALEAFEYEDNFSELEKYKNAASKANSEAAEWRKKHNALLSEEEQKKQANEEELTTLRAKVEAMEKEKLIAGHKAQFLAIGYDEDGKDVATRPEFYLVGAEGNILEWTKWDLSALGKVVKIDFNVTGSNDNGYGFSQPAYFAYDDVAVRF